MLFMSTCICEQSDEYCKSTLTYQLELASSPGPTQILSRSRGCEIKSGWGLGTRLNWSFETLNFPIIIDAYKKHTLVPH